MSTVGREIWQENRFVDSFSSVGTFSSSFIGGPVFHPIDDWEHPLLYLPGIGIDSQISNKKKKRKEKKRKEKKMLSFFHWMVLSPLSKIK